VYLRLLADAPSEAQKSAAVSTMRKAAGALRRELGAQLRAKYTPELQFFWDDAMDRGHAVSAVIDELAREREDQDGDRG
jgi:ribosome-binding factor A